MVARPGIAGTGVMRYGFFSSSCLRALVLALFGLLPLLVRAHPAQADGFRAQLSRSVAVRGAPLPYSAIVDVTPRGPTRLGIRILLDLRYLQRNAPGLLSTVLDETCNHKYAIAVADAGASGPSVTLRGQFQAKFFTCNTKTTQYC